MRRRRAAVALVALLAVAALFASHRSRTYGHIAVHVAPARLGHLSGRLSLTGTFDYANVTEIKSEVVAPVAKMAVGAGQHVRAGDLLVELRAPDIDAEVDRLEATVARVTAELAQTQVKFELARANETRMASLGRKQLVPLERVESAQHETESAQAGVRAARASLKEAELAVRHARATQQKLRITAPVDGTVVDIGIREGEVAIPTSAALPGALLMKIADTSRLIARVDLSEVELSKLKVGDTAAVRSSLLGGPALPGSIIELRARPGTGDEQKFQGAIAFAPDALPIRIVHTSCVADIELDDGGAGLVVPLEAVRYPGQNFGTETFDSAYVIRLQAGRLGFTPVDTGISDNLHQRIERGLQEGDLVVTGPASALSALTAGEEVEADPPRSAR